MVKYHVILLFALITQIHCHKILAYVPTPSYSHQVIFRPLWRELSLRGHQVTLLTTDPINDSNLTNLTEIDLGFSYKDVQETIEEIVKSNFVESFKIFGDSFVNTVEEQLRTDIVQELIREGSFDIVIAEFLTAIPFAFAEKFQCPSIAVTSLPALEPMHEAFGSPTHPVLYPNVLLPFTKAETLLERVASFLFDYATRIYFNVLYIPQQEKVIAKYFGEDFPSYAEIVGKISLLLENTEPLLDKVRPRVPLTIPIGGLHKVPARPLPKEIKNVLDSAKNGFVYFSLGSNVKSSSIPKDLRQIFLETFSELPYTVVWKFDVDPFEEKPKNVFIFDWLPQVDVLRHPNIQLFITQGGIQSFEEAIVAKVPMLGIPYFGDQHKNIKKMVANGFGLSLDHNTLSKKQFKESILEVVTNPVYRNQIHRLSDLIDDKPMTALDEAVWWIEYVLRHKGTEHLRSPLLDIPWYQYYMLDVISVVLLLFGLLMILVVAILRVNMQILKFVFTKLTAEKSKKD